MADPLLDPLSQAYLAHLGKERCPTNTYRARRRVLLLVGNAGAATVADVEAWWDTRRDLKPATRANDLACLRVFYRWCARWGHRLDDPTVRLDAPRVTKGIPRPIDEGRLRAALDLLAAEVTEDPKEAPVLRALALGAYAGFRIGESAWLPWDEVDVERRVARVLGKGQKWRVVALSSALLTRLGDPVPGGSVLTGTGKFWGSGYAERRVNRTLARLGAEATSHQLRHRYGTRGWRASHDLVALGRQMGHASPATTMIYTLEDDDAGAAIADAVAG